MENTELFHVEYTQKFLLGLVSVKITIEETYNQNPARKYRHTLMFRVLWLKYGGTIYSPSAGDYVFRNYTSLKLRQLEECFNNREY